MSPYCICSERLPFQCKAVLNVLLPWGTMADVANADHVATVLHGVATWNRWRAEFHGDPDLSGAELGGTELKEANLNGTNLSGARLEGANLRRAKLSSADLRGATFAQADLSRANLGGAKIGGANFRGAKLCDADLSHANVYAADFKQANLSGADLYAANFTGTDLSGADLSEANLGCACFQSTLLSNADFLGATFNETILSNLNLGLARGLETTVHLRPSAIDHRTLGQSGRLPRDFLRGCGLPENVIDYLPALFDRPVSFYSLFISYSKKDQDFADRVHADLQAKGVRCWFAPNHMEPGKKIHEQIDEAIRVHERVLLILSPASMESEWVKPEIAKARNREVKEHRRVLFPVRLVAFESLRDWECFDADTGKDSAREIREYFIPDFSHWKDDHNSYEREFERLLGALKAEAQKTRP